MRRPTAGSLLNLPHLVVTLVLVANLAAYLACLRVGGSLAVQTPPLVAVGALTPAAGFLHADPTRLLANLLSLLIAGPVLERRIGPTTFAPVYAASLARAGVTSVLMHPGPFVGVGASGATFGITGALFATLTLLALARPLRRGLGDVGFVGATRHTRA